MTMLYILSACKLAIGLEPVGFFDVASKYQQGSEVPWEMRNIGKMYDDLTSK